MGDGIRARRRSDKMFVWALYTVGKAIDEGAGGTSGSFTLSSSRYKMAATAYAVASDGTISLTSATQKTASQIAVGDYLVSVSTSNNTSTTGTTLYKVTSVSGSTSRTIRYTAYTPADAVGSDTGKRVRAKPSTYPDDGVYNGYFYVLLRGETTIHEWDIYNVTSVDNYVVETANYATVSVQATATVSYSTEYQIVGNKIELKNPKTATLSSLASNLGQYYWTRGGEVYKGGTVFAESGIVSGPTLYRLKNYPIKQKGSATGNTAISAARKMYPTDGIKGNYWYTYSQSYYGYINQT